MTDDGPIQRRTPEERRAYTQGIATGATLILDQLDQGRTPAQARMIFNDVYSALKRADEAPDG